MASSFRDFDNPAVYQEVRKALLNPSTLNFVVEFGQSGAQIGLNLDDVELKLLLKDSSSQRGQKNLPVRWINIWAPNRQTKVVEVIANHYELSKRFQAILKSKPENVKQSESQRRTNGERRRAKPPPKYDAELGMNGSPPKASTSPEGTNFYSIASHLINYQSVDLGEKFTCIGNNWMYHPTRPGKDGDQPVTFEKRLWSWLFLCDDSTVISVHEDPMIDLLNVAVDEGYMKAIRGHSLNLLSQVSEQGIKEAGSVSMTSVRLLLAHSGSQTDPGLEGSSNLFYYLFDYWQESYLLIIRVQGQLEDLAREILSDIDSKHRKETNKGIIRDLYQIGKQLRTNQRLYEGYKNIIDRVLEVKATSHTNGTASPIFPHTTKRVPIARTAAERFERLGDRIKLLVLNSIAEAVAEKDALLSTYFNITAQKDSEATAKLSRNATLLSRLGVLFLPVSVMTAYFSVQIQDLQGVYTSKTYWIAFAIIMSISILCLFFLSRLLMTVTESLDARTKAFSLWCSERWPRRQQQGEDGYDEPEEK